MSDTEHQSIRQLAERLGLEATTETVDKSADAIGELEETAESLTESPSTVADQGSPSEDDHNAFLTVYEEPRREQDDGALAGLAVAVKDNIAVRGLQMTCGSEGFSIVPERDATVVERLIDAGAAVLGKTNMDAFAFGPSGEFSDFGRVTNPLDADRVPGGSSSGSAVAVATDTVDAALGTDTGGSVRMPAACCGIVGAKPSHRLVPRDGFVDFAPSLDTIGPLAADVKTAAQVLDEIKGKTHRDPSSRRVRTESFADGLDEHGEVSIGVPEVFIERSAPAVADTIDTVADDLGGEPGVSVRSIDLDLGEIQNAYFLTAATEFVWYFRQSAVIRGQGTGYDEDIRAELSAIREDGLESQHLAWRILPPAFVDDGLDGQGYAAAQREIARFQRELDEHFETVDLLLTPTIRDLPPEYDRMDSTTELMNLLGNTAPFNLTGMPGVSVPVAEKDGLPISAQIVAPVLGDRRALQGARLVERVAETDRCRQ